MPRVRCQAVRWISEDPFPGIVECHLVDVDGAVQVIVDKTAVVDDTDRLQPDAVYPIELTLDCRLVSETADTVEVELAYGMTDADDRATFRVARDHFIS